MPQQPLTLDVTLGRINEGVQLHHHQGQPAAARDLFTRIAREYLQHAQAGIGVLGDDQYGQLIKGGLDRLTQQLTLR